MKKHTLTIPAHILGFLLLVCTAPFISTWMWYRLLFALCFLEGAALGYGILKAIANKR